MGLLFWGVACFVVKLLGEKLCPNLMLDGVPGAIGVLIPSFRAESLPKMKTLVFLLSPVNCDS